MGIGIVAACEIPANNTEPVSNNFFKFIYLSIKLNLKKEDSTDSNFSLLKTVSPLQGYS
jgi:hypothetical protein